MKISELINVVNDNLEFFKNDKSGQIFCESFRSLLEIVTQIIPIIENIESFASEYDFDEKTPGNGYRSFVYLVESAVRRVLKICEHVRNKRENIFFRKTHNEK